MKVVVAAGGRFHAIRLAQELYKRNALKKLISGSYTQEDEKILPSSYVDRIKSTYLLDSVIARLRLQKIIQPSKLYIFKDNLFDASLGKIISHNESFDIFVGFAHYFYKSLPIIRSKAKIIIIESGSCHITEHARLIQEGYEKIGIPFQSINTDNIEKIKAEYAAADYIMTPSMFARQSFLAQGFNPEKILTIPCGMDIDFFKNSTLIRTNRKKFRLLFVGQLQIGKGVHILLEAWRQLKLPISNAELVLVGNIQKDIALYLQKNFAPAGVNFMRGMSRRELKQMYESADAFVLPSLQDGFGMVLGEAMASGLPVIASTHTGAPDIFKNPDEGILVPSGDIEALATAINRLYCNPDLRTTMGSVGQQRIKDFTWQQYGTTVFETYSKILAQYETPTITHPPYREMQPQP